MSARIFPCPFFQKTIWRPNYVNRLSRIINDNISMSILQYALFVLASATTYKATIQSFRIVFEYKLESRFREDTQKQAIWYKITPPTEAQT